MKRFVSLCLLLLAAFNPGIALAANSSGNQAIGELTLKIASETS